MAIALFTDFGREGPYLGQMEAAIERIVPNCKVINLVSNAPTADPLLSAYLLSALRHSFPAGTVFLSVVDPGVGGERAAVVLKADGQWFVGPDNGLLNTVAVHALQTEWFEITWRPPNCSASFHGRDIFAPVAARLANNTAGDRLRPIDKPLAGWAEDLPRIIYFDHYGNAMTGLRYHAGWQDKTIEVKGHRIEQANTFCEVSKGQLFWYKNSSDLIEIAANQDEARTLLNLKLGDEVGC